VQCAACTICGQEPKVVYDFKAFTEMYLCLMPDARRACLADESCKIMS
jgi:hypothetical protein